MSEKTEQKQVQGKSGDLPGGGAGAVILAFPGGGIASPDSMAAPTTGSELGAASTATSQERLSRALQALAQALQAQTIAVAEFRSTMRDLRDQAEATASSLQTYQAELARTDAENIRVRATATNLIHWADEAAEGARVAALP